MSEQESMSERELAEWMESELYSDKPKSVGEALAAAEVEQPPEEVPVEGEPAPEEPPVVVTDEPVQPPAPEPEEREPTDEEREALEDVEQREPEDDADPNVAWATKRFGPDTAKWAKVARDQDQQIGRLAAEKKEAEDLAGQWYDYAQQVETAQPQVQMPLSSQEEAWADQAMANPVQYAAQAAMQGNIQLYNAIIERVAYQDPRQASAVETEVRLQLIAAAEHEEQQAQEPDFQTILAAAVQRAGIDIPTYGQPMMEKISELGEHHPYVQTILEGDDQARDIALMAVLDMVRSSSLSTRKVRNDSREEQLRREGELRKQAAGVVTGGGSRNPQEKGSPFMEAMEQEWRDRGQWTSEE